MLSIVTSSLLLAKTRTRLKTISGLTGYDFTRFAFQVCLGIHVFKCFQFWLWDRAIQTHRLSYRESTIDKVSALFSPSLTADSKESCNYLVACMLVEIFMRQGGWLETGCYGSCLPEVIIRKSSTVEYQKWEFLIFILFFLLNQNLCIRV